ncbi:MAG: AAA family ATPase, partial [Deltaproteobacteria bacterium]|nr:AAA family ATPase [Deltaproteobacteria bacterium]
MDTFIFASLRAGAGKTSLIVGIADSLDRQIGYIKPFGDRMLYSKKRLWDYDAALMTHLYNMQVTPDEMSIGFDHSKLRYMFDEATVRQQLKELAAGIGAERDILFVEGGASLSYGTSIHLDALSIARALGGKLVLIISGDDDTILDDIMFVKHSVTLAGIELAGLIVNKVHHVDDFMTTCLRDIKKEGLNVIGVVPHSDNLT